MTPPISPEMLKLAAEKGMESAALNPKAGDIPTFADKKFSDVGSDVLRVEKDSNIPKFAENDPDARIEAENSGGETDQNAEVDPDVRIESESEEKRGLTPEEKEQLKAETGWSDEIVDAISSMEEAQIYKDAGLVETEINGKPCLINPNIDMDTQTDAFGRTNRQRMSEGLAPLDESGKPIELHHIGQHPDSPLAELTQEQHRGKDNYSVLHDTKKESEIDRPAFDSERVDHWKTRAEGENA